MKTFTSMPMLKYGELIKKYPKCPAEVPFELLDEATAKSNHSQTLQRLAERGGLYPSEMIAVIAKRKYLDGQDIGMCIESINVHLYNYEQKLKKESEVKKEWTTPITWDEFRETGLLFHVNEILHPFGMAIAVQMDKDGHVTGTVPLKVKYRGFSEKDQDKQHIKIANYLAANAPNFPEDIK